MPGNCHDMATWDTLVDGQWAGHHGLAHARTRQIVGSPMDVQLPEFRDDPDELMFDIYCCKFENLSGLDIKSPPRVASGLRLKTVIYPLL